MENDRYLDVINFRKTASLDTVLYMDEINTVECVNATVDREDRLCDKPWDGASLAYNRLAKEGLISVVNCTFPLPGDGLCEGRYLR